MFETVPEGYTYDDERALYYDYEGRAYVNVADCDEVAFYDGVNWSFEQKREFLEELRCILDVDYYYDVEVFLAPVSWAEYYALVGAFSSSWSLDSVARAIECGVPIEDICA